MMILICTETTDGTKESLVWQYLFRQLVLPTEVLTTVHYIHIHFGSSLLPVLFITYLVCSYYLLYLTV